MKKWPLAVLAFMLFFSTPSFADPVVGINGSGAVKFGDASALACDPTTEGSLRYDSGGDVWQYCDAVTWRDLASGSGSATPAGNTGEIQFNSGGAFAADANLNWADGANFLTSGTFGASPALTAAGAGTRMFFYPRKAAFRAGSVNGTQWDDANIGNYSVAMGFLTTASGNNSTALGWDITASGQASTAIGVNNTASGNESTAMGRSNTASGIRSTAMGYQAKAGSGTAGDGNGDYSFAIGLQSANQTGDPKITGDRSMALFFDGGVADANSGFDLTANDLFAIIGGRALIDPTRTKVDTATGGEQNLELHVQGDLGALNYCDEAGNNCFTAAGVASNVPGAPDRGIQFNSGGAFTADNNFIFTSAGLLGIGTATPQELVHVNNAAGDARLRIQSGPLPSAPEILLYRDTTKIGDIFTSNIGSNTHLYIRATYDDTPADGHIRLLTGGNSIGNPIMTLESKGDAGVGIWDTSPDAALEINKNGLTHPLFMVSSTVDADGDLFTIDNNGNIGIGDPTPDSGTGGQLLLDVEGNVGAINYCDEAGNNCFTAADAGGLWTDNTTHISYQSAHIIKTGQALPAGFDADGMRMFFYPDKGAFRGGAITGGNDAWQDANIGANSFAFGQNAQASGEAGTAMGSNTTASGQYSTAIGNSNIASNNYSVAMGSSNQATGWNSTAMGSNTIASGNRSTAMGQWTIASGQLSTAMGESNTASGDRSTAMGENNTASGLTSTVMGFDVTAGSGTAGDGAGDFSFAIGLQSASQAPDPKITGDRSMALFFDGGVADANSGYDFTDSDKFALIGGEFQIDDQSSTANKGCIRYNSATTKIEYSHDCSSYAELGSGGGGTPAGNSGEIQFNSGGSFAAMSTFQFSGSGELLLGTATPNNDGSTIFKGVTDGNNGDMKLYTYSSGSAGTKSDYELFRARGTEASPAIVATSDILGTLRFSGYDGDQFLPTARFEAFVDATPSNNSVSTGLRLFTGTNNPASPAMTITSSGSVGIGTSATDIGGLLASFGGGTTLTVSDTSDSDEAVFINIEGRQITDGEPFGSVNFLNNGNYQASLSAYRDGADTMSALDLATADGITGTHFVAKNAGIVVYNGSAYTNPVPDSGTGGQLLLDVEGNVGALNYCDEAGNNCFTAAGVAGSVPGAPDRGIQFNSGGSFASDANFVFSSAGRLGIGTNAPAAALHADITGAGGSIAMMLENSGDVGVGFDNGASQAAIQYDANTNGFEFRTGGMGAGDIHMFIADGGNVGIGTATPQSALDVAGGIKVANDAAACNAAKEGTMRYSTGNKCLELCDGASWACISVGACSDATPDAFDFTDLANQATSTQVESNILQITGLGCAVNVAISGEGSPQYRTCSDATCSTVIQDWTAASATVANTDYLQVRLTTSAAGGDTYSATISVGNFADVWNATPTGDCTGSPAAGTVCPDGTIYAGQSPDGNVKMYVSRCDAGQSWDGAACTGSRFSLNWNNGTSNWTTTGYTSAIAGETNTAGIAALSDAGSPHYAAQYCDGLSQDGYTDWYLPAKDELNVIYGNKNVIGNFASASYWSSSEGANYGAWRQSFSDGSQSLNSKNSAFFVRCARRD